MEKCEICEARLETHPPYCGKCRDEVIIPAYRHVDSLETTFFHGDRAFQGRNVREAYIAGYKAAIEKGTQENDI